MVRVMNDDGAPHERGAAPEPPELPGRLRGPARLLAVAAATLLGVQLTRLLFPLISWYLRDTVGVGVTSLLPYAVAPFALALLAPLVRRLAGVRWTLLGSAAALALTTIVAQLVGSPHVRLWCAMLGLTAFWWWLICALSVYRREWAHGVVLGLLSDAVLRGATHTLDVAWTTGPTTWIVIALAVLLSVLTWTTPPDEEPAGPRLGAALPLLAVGPLLFVELLILQNQGWVATATGWGPDASLLLIAIGGVASLFGVTLGRTLPGQGATGVIGGVVLLIILVQVGLDGVLYAFLLIAAKLGAGMVWGAVTAPTAEDERRGPAAAAVVLGLGAILFVALGLGYYLSFELPIPVGQDLLLVAIGGLIAALGLGASVSKRPAGEPVTTALVLGVLLVAAPAIWLATDAPTSSAVADDVAFPVTVATYNVHGAFTTDGVQDPDALARTIEELDADVLGLQEVSRGWLLNGGTDLIAWLQERLDYPYVAFHATTQDPVWGNAILSRAPLDNVRRELLPEGVGLVRRGVLEADVALSSGNALHVMVTHLHHASPDLEVLHDEQVAAVLDAWQREARTVLLGDLNTEPDSRAYRTLVGAGFSDVWTAVGDGEGLTWSSASPERRIDYVFITADLSARAVRVVASTASDHLPVVAELVRAR